ncbi:hypothetical protein [Enterobacter roggenkampii]|uniref:hypothetical protein n=1 Tax=Enterobacter roggenkampii TaxID=1812935 RepID=UPI00191648D1|nr:hypothetical protein [Enterobacter roggenkampii]
MDESRKAFEQWYLLNWGHTEDNHEALFEVSSCHGDYYRLGVRMAYDAWQASRAAIEIELPEWFSPNDCGDRAMWSDAVEKAILAAGIKVKE